MGRCIVAGGKPDMAAPVSYKVNFSDNTWKQIIDACQKNAVPDTWLVGDQKAMNINGTDYLIDIIGKNHDDYSDGSGKAPLTFQLHDCYGTTYKMNDSSTNSGGWNSSAMRTTHLPAIMKLMPSEVQNGIRTVNKPSGKGGGTSSGIQTSIDTLFLLSEIEIFGETTHSVSGEGSQYEYYMAGNTRLKKLGESVSNWVERSTASGSSDSFCMVYVFDGIGAAATNLAANSRAVSFAFCF